MSWMSWNFVRCYEILFQTDAESFSFLSWKTKKNIPKKKKISRCQYQNKKSFVYWLNFLGRFWLLLCWRVFVVLQPNMERTMWVFDKIGKLSKRVGKWFLVISSEANKLCTKISLEPNKLKRLVVPRPSSTSMKHFIKKDAFVKLFET